MRAVIYIRLSVHRGDTDPSLSPQRQEQICRAYAEAKQWDVTEVISDLDVSGSDKGARLARPGLDQIRRLWGSIDVIVFSKLDRLARNVSDFRAFAEEAQANGAALVSVAESLDLSSPSGRFVATILAAFAEMEAATIADRVAGGVRSTRLAGRYAGGYTPWGYTSTDNAEGAGRVLEVEETEAAVLREAARRLLAGESLGAISRDMNARGLRAKMGGQITRQALAQALTSEAILGRTVIDGRAVLGDDGLPLTPFTPIISLEDHHQIRLLLQPSTHRKPRGSRHLLVGLLRCHSCDGPMSTQGTTYSCKSRSAGKTCKAPVHVNIVRTDAYVENEFLSAFGNLSEMRWEADRTPDSRVGKVNDAIRVATETMRESGADIEALAKTVAELVRQRDELLNYQPQPTLTPTGRTIGEAWVGFTTSERRDLLAEAVDVIVIHPAVTPRQFDTARIRLWWRED